jgi:hypothetical protein
MSGLRSTLPSSGILLGLVAALATGFLGSWAGQVLAGRFSDASWHEYVALSAAVVVGAIGGAFGRHISGLLALWLGVIAAASLGIGLGPPAIEPVTSFQMTLIITLFGYALGRMVDPIWGGRTS